MRCYKFILAVFLALGLSACSGGPGPDDIPPSPAAGAVTPAADMGDGAAVEATEAGRQNAGWQAADSKTAPFPGQANMIPTIKAVTEFCKRPGSLAFMTRDGCSGALSQLSHDISANLYFENMEDCQGFLQARRTGRNNIVAVHREWCERSYPNLHDRKGCYDAAPVFLGSFTEQGFCRLLPPKSKKPTDSEAPYLYGYSEPGQKFDSPKTGYPPAVKKAAPAKKLTGQKVVAVKPAPALTPATGVKNVARQAQNPGPEQAAQSAVPQPAVPQPAAPRAAPEAQAPAAHLSATPANGLDLQAPGGIPSWPDTMDFSSTPEARGGQSPDATTGPNAVSPNAVPEAIRATSGGQVEHGARAVGAAALIPVLPEFGLPVVPDLPEPAIGPRVEVEALPPVPSLGRIAPQLMPGVPPDTAVSENTLPTEEEAPQITEVPQGSPLGADAFSGIIPNFVPPPPPNPFDSQTQPLPLGGPPAGQSGS